MPKIGINVFIQLILLSCISAVVVFTTSNKRLRKPCFNYNAKERHSVIKVKDIYKRHWNPCRHSNGIDILQVKENGRNTSTDTNLIVCTQPKAPDFVLQFKGTIIRVVSRHGMAEVLTCRHMSDTLVVRTNPDSNANGQSYIAVKVRQNQNMDHFGVLSFIDENNYGRRETYDLILSTEDESTLFTRDEAKNKQNRVERSVKQTNPADGSNRKPTYKPTETSECGVSRACFRIGSNSCSHFQCLYYLSYKVINDGVDIELSGKTSGWIAVGFSFEDKWDGSDVLACVRSGPNTHSVRIEAFSGTRNKTPVLKPSLSNLKHSQIHGGYLYCRIMLPINRHSKEVKYLNLNTELYQLYARGSISEDNEIMPVGNTEISKSAKTISIYNNHMNVQNVPVVKQPYPLYQQSFITAESECGVNRGCFRHGPPSCSHFECLYYLSYKVNAEKDRVDIELSGKTMGWLAVGFSSDNKMGGDDIIACQRLPQTGGVHVVAYSDLLPRQRPDEKPSQANITHVESRDEFIYCRMVIPITRKQANERTSYLDLSNEWYQLYAKGMVSSVGNMLQHIEAPMTSSGQLTILRNTVNVQINHSSNTRVSYYCLTFLISFSILNFLTA